MAINYWIPVGIAVLAVALTFGVQLLLAEVFPFHMLTAHKHGKPTVTTKSYAGRTVMVTGANGAYGSRAAKIFADRDVDTLILVDFMDCNPLKEQIEASIEGKKKPNILVWKVDMMNYASCQELGRKARELKSLDHVLMTAGILAFNRRESPEGWETCKCPIANSVAYCDWLTMTQLSRSTTSPRPSSLCSFFPPPSLLQPTRTRP